MIHLMKRSTKIILSLVGVLTAATIYFGHQFYKNRPTLGDELYKEALQTQEKYRKLKAEGKNLDDFTQPVKEEMQQPSSLEKEVDDSCIIKIDYEREYLLNGESIGYGSDIDLDGDGILERIETGVASSGDLLINGNFIADTMNKDLILYKDKYILRIKDHDDSEYTQNLYFKWDGTRLKSYKNEYIIQVAAFKVDEWAATEKKVDFLRSQGFQSYVIFTNYKREHWNRVYVGLFSKKEDALLAKECYQFMNPEDKEPLTPILRK